MRTMSTSQSQIDDLCDARAQVRTLRKEVLTKRLALREVKQKLSEATERIEDVLTEIEQRQGRLPFEGATEQKQEQAAQEPYAPGIPARRKRREAEGPRA